MRTLFLLSLLTLSTAAVDLAADLKGALTFRATFDGTTDASAALGDKRFFVALSYKEQAAARLRLSGWDVVLDPLGAATWRRASLPQEEHVRRLLSRRQKCFLRPPRLDGLGLFMAEPGPGDGLGTRLLRSDSNYGQGLE